MLTHFLYDVGNGYYITNFDFEIFHHIVIYSSCWIHTENSINLLFYVLLFFQIHYCEMTRHVLVYGFFLVLFEIKTILCRQTCYYYQNNSNILKSVRCAYSCCYSGNNYFNSISQTCCTSRNNSTSTSWWVVFPVVIFVIFLSVTLLKVCCFKGRPMVLGRGKPVTFSPNRAQPVIIHTNSNNPYPNNPYPNNNPFPNNSNQYRQNQPAPNIGFTGQNYNNNAYASDPNFNNNTSGGGMDGLPKYEDLSIIPPQANRTETETKPPIGFNEKY